MKCPTCNEPMGKHPALSRRDNKTEICSECGMMEALEDWAGARRRIDGLTNIKQEIQFLYDEGFEKEEILQYCRDTIRRVEVPK
jgi:hypothetical protein